MNDAVVAQGMIEYIEEKARSSLDNSIASNFSFLLLMNVLKAFCDTQNSGHVLAI